MDQLKVALQWLQKNHYWVLTAIIPMVGVGSWMSASGAIQKEITSNINKVKSEFTTQKGYGSKSYLANSKIISQQTKENDALKAKVGKVWAELYQRQEKKALLWPASLTKQFHTHIAKREFGDDIVEDYRADYHNYVKEVFQTLTRIVDSQEIKTEASNALAGGSRGMMGESRGMMRMPMGGGLGAEKGVEEDYTVYWDPKAAATVQAKLTWQKTPSSMVIWKTQEDLWAYQTLLQIIANTNKASGATRKSNAVVSEIHELLVGREAVLSSRGKNHIQIIKEDSTEAGGGRGMGDSGVMIGRGGMDDPGVGAPGVMIGRGGMDDPGEMIGRGGMDDPGGLMGGGMAGGGGLFANRYVDQLGQPMAPSGDDYNAEDFGVGFKRLPVKMTLKMDQTWLSYLISECANAELQVEIKELHINPTGGTRSGMLGGPAAAGMIASFNRESANVLVELHGIVYIFSKPDLDKIGGAGDEGSAESDLDE